MNKKEIIERLKWIGLRLFIVFVLFSLISIYIFDRLEKSEPCYCVQVDNESDFIGPKLKCTKSIMNEVVKLDKCLKIDEKIDDEDGKDSGKVRWFECKEMGYEYCKMIGSGRDTGLVKK